MSKANEKKSLNNSNRAVLRVFIVVVILAFMWFIIPLYMQNRVNSLYAVSQKLSEQISFLRADILLQELEINKASSLEQLYRFGERAELGLYDVPKKVQISRGVK